MPIGDLLASISGGASKASASSRPSPAGNIKRKASSELPGGGATSKARRITPPPSRPNLTSRPTSDRVPSTSGGGGRYAGTAASRPTAPVTSKPSRPASSTSPSLAVAPSAKSAPKKGSFAEILARGKAAQASMGQVGKIQHKKVENPPKRSKEELQEAAAVARQASRGKKPVAAASLYGGTSRLSQRPAGGATNGSGASGSSSSAGAARQRPTTASGPAARRASAAAAAAAGPERKVKKAATATTGYAGTARPKPGGDVKKRHDAPRGGALLTGPKVRRARQYDDEEDEDMDDFIDYDEEEDDEGAGGDPRGYNYASDASSDMEAGMDDIYDEEDRAARIARQEDIREERLEKSLKAAKEERRRRIFGGGYR